jgi:RHS repeat-associated protein
MLRVAGKGRRATRGRRGRSDHSRLQTVQTRQVSLGSCSQTGGPGSPACSQDQWWLQNIYGTPSNNGNILQQNIGLPGGITIPEAYSYDTANRLTVASEQSSNPSNPPFPDANCRYCEGYTYDIWGNRTEAVGGLLGPSTLAPGSFSPYTNQITSAGWAYETTGRGNITQEPGGRTYLYDSENRQVAFCTQDPGGCVNQSGPGRTLYVYDGDGRRVQKSEPAGTTTYVYDAQGNLAAEYSTEPGTSQTLYLTADQLGTTRVVTTGTPGASSVVARRDYLPFGEQIVPASGDPRMNVTGYTQAEGVTLQFTGKERDGASGESGLDYFESRYFSSAQGRFTSPDEPLFDQRAGDPQSWNLYTYGRNNPLSYIDPSGNCSVKAGASAATDDPGEPCVAPGGTSVTVTAQGGDPDEARIAQFQILVAGDLNIQLREARDIGVSTYVSSILGWGVSKFILGPAIRVAMAKYAAQQALRAATSAVEGARAGRVWAAEYDVETGAVAVGHSGPVPNAADVHPDLMSALDNAGGLGAKNPGVNGAAGCCGEVDAANQLLQKGSKMENIRFTDAIRPKSGATIPTCPNCQVTFGTGK